MQRLEEEVRTTGRLSVEQRLLKRIPRRLLSAANEEGAHPLEHLKVVFCALPDEGLALAFPNEDEDDEDLREVPSMAGLQSLQLNYNGLTRLPSGISQLCHLKELLLDNNRLSAVPPALLGIKTLEVLVLSYNNIAEIPDEFWGNFPRLRYLSVHHNKLTRVTDSLYDAPPSLEVLYLHYNAIDTIDEPSRPVSNDALSGLRTFSLSHNKLSQLPDALLQRLTGLKLFFLEYNEFVSLPESIGRLAQLHLLRVDSNSITKLPDSVGHLTQLICLDCDHNKLVTLPDSLFKLCLEGKLKILRLDDNKALSKDARTLNGISQVLQSSAFHFLGMSSTLSSAVSKSASSSSRSAKLALPALTLDSLWNGICPLSEIPNVKISPLKSLSLPVSQLHVYRQWDPSSCGYHALKNALFAVLAVTHRTREEEISWKILSLTRSPAHYWTLFFHWQQILLNRAKAIAKSAKAAGRKTDEVWNETSLKHGVLERNYIKPLFTEDPLLSEIGDGQIVVIADLAYLESDPFSVQTIQYLHQQLLPLHLQPGKNRGRKGVNVKAYVFGVSKSHFVAVIGYRTHAGESRYLVADSSRYEDPSTLPSAYFETDESEDSPSKKRSLSCTTEAIINCLEGTDTFTGYYLDEMVQGFIKQSLMNLFDPDTGEVDEPRIEEWCATFATFLGSLNEKTLDLGPEYLKESTKKALVDFVQQIRMSGHKQLLEHLQIPLLVWSDALQRLLGVDLSRPPKKQKKSVPVSGSTSGSGSGGRAVRRTAKHKKSNKFLIHIEF